MERQELINRMANADTTLDLKRLITVAGASIKASCDAGDPKRTLVIAMEELAELSQQASKLYRDKAITVDVEEEFADAVIALAYILLLSNATVSDICRAINVKLDNLQEHIDANDVL